MCVCIYICYIYRVNLELSSDKNRPFLCTGAARHSAVRALHYCARLSPTNLIIFLSFINWFIK